MAGIPTGFTLVAADRYILRYLVGFDAQTPGPFTRTHAELMADMAEGPLKDLWTPDFPPLSAAEVIAQRLMYDSHSRIEVDVRTLGAAVVNASAVPTADANDQSQLVVTLLGAPDGAFVVLVTLEFRHSTGR